MQGEYRGDFSRDTFNPLKQYSRVLMQQGRVLLDADWNEQTAILLHYLRSLAADLLGPHAGPDRRPIDPITNKPVEVSKREALDFELKPTAAYDFQIGAGHYYVAGQLCQNSLNATYKQLYSKEPLSENRRYLVYLDVWERHITPLDDDAIRESALGGPHTATRAQVQWQLKVTSQYWRKDAAGTDQLSDIPAELDAGVAWRDWVNARWADWLAHWQPLNRGQLKAKALADPSKATDPCNVPPEARYRGENQLYRVQIHQGGKVTANAKPTFKWSRDNSAIEFAITAIATTSNTTTVTLADLGRDDYLSLHEGDWVELVDDEYTLKNLAEPLLQVAAVDRVLSTVTLTGKAVRPYDGAKRPRLRRWDHHAGDPKLGGLTLIDGAAEIKVATNANEDWLMLEDGIQIQFQPGGQLPDGKPDYGDLRTGDYWLIPARAATGDVEWPGSVANPESQGPHGVEHVYAPLAIVAVDVNGNVTVSQDCRRLWEPLGKPL